MCTSFNNFCSFSCFFQQFSDFLLDLLDSNLWMIWYDMKIFFYLCFCSLICFVYFLSVIKRKFTFFNSKHFAVVCCSRLHYFVDRWDNLLYDETILSNKTCGKYAKRNFLESKMCFLKYFIEIKFYLSENNLVKNDYLPKWPNFNSIGYDYVN